MWKACSMYSISVAERPLETSLWMIKIASFAKQLRLTCNQFHEGTARVIWEGEGYAVHYLGGFCTVFADLRSRYL